jgi:hypothetical protein
MCDVGDISASLSSRFRNRDRFALPNSPDLSLISLVRPAIRAPNKLDRSRRAQFKLLKDSSPALSLGDRLEQHLVYDHLAKHMDRSRVYSCPADVLSLTSLSAQLDEPATKRHRGPDGSAAAQFRPEVDLLGGDGQGIDSMPPVLYFQLIHAHIGRKKTVPISVGAGGQVRDGDLLVSLHNSMTGFSDAVVLSSRAAIADSVSGPGFVLSGFQAKLPEVQALDTH